LIVHLVRTSKFELTSSDIFILKVVNNSLSHVSNSAVLIEHSSVTSEVAASLSSITLTVSQLTVLSDLTDHSLTNKNEKHLSKCRCIVLSMFNKEKEQVTETEQLSTAFRAQLADSLLNEINTVVNQNTIKKSELNDLKLMINDDELKALRIENQ